MDITWKIAIGVGCGILGALFSYEAIQAQRAKAAVEQVQRQWQAEQAAMAERSRQQADVARARAAAKANHEAAIQRNQAEERSRQSDAREAKERAWKQYFRPTEACQRDSTQVECANAYILAKREFEARYQPQ